MVGRGGDTVYRDSLVIGGHKMIDDLADSGLMKEKKLLAKMASTTCMGCWLADLADPLCTSLFLSALAN